MPTAVNYVSAADPRFPGVNNSILQASPVVLEVFGAMADNDDTAYTFEAEDDSKLPPRAILVSRHTGGDITNTTPAATYAVSDGDTLVLQIDRYGRGTFVEYTHTLSGLTAGLATAAQIAASINGDASINGMVRAEAGLTATAVTLFPKTERGALRVIAGTSVVGLAWPGTTADNKNRTYVSQDMVSAGGTGWSWSFVASTRTLSVKNENGAAVNRVQVLVLR